MKKGAAVLLLLVCAVGIASAGFEWKYYYGTAVAGNPYASLPSWGKSHKVINDCATDAAGHSGMGYAVRIWPDYPRPCSNWIDIESVITYICPPPYADEAIDYQFVLRENDLATGLPGARLKYRDGITDIPTMPFTVLIGDIWHKAQVPAMPGDPECFYQDQINNAGFWVCVEAIDPPTGNVYHWYDSGKNPPVDHQARFIYNGGSIAKHHDEPGDLPVGVTPKHGAMIIACLISKHHYQIQSILAPTGNVNQGALITPRVRINNAKPFPSGYPGDFGNLHLTIRPSGGGPAVYDQWIYNYALPVSGNNVATFPSANASWPAGAYQVKCTLDLWYDWSHFDKVKTATMTIVVTDIGAIEVYEPSGSYVENTVITPTAEVQNFGSETATFQARFWIEGTSYDELLTVPDLEPNVARTVTFPEYVAGPLGNHLAHCEVLCGGDMNAANNLASSGFEVTGAAPPRADVGATVVVSPTATIRRWSRYPLTVTVKNFGEMPASFPVIAELRSPTGGLYTYTASVENLAAGGEREVTFITRRYNRRGEWQVHAYTDLTGDINAANNACDGAFEVRGMPGWQVLGAIPSGPVSRQGSALAGGGEEYYVLLGKNKPQILHFANELDVAQVIATVPEPDRKIGKGTSMLTLDGKLYVLNANKSFTFQALDLTSGTWSTLANLPGGASARPANAGAALTIAGGMIYVLKGGRTPEAYCYNPATNEWRQLASLPEGKFKTGAALTSNGERLFVLLGGTDQFWTYNIADNSWQPLASLPLKAKAGAALGYYNGSIYATAGSNNAFYVYDLTGNRWTELEQVPSDRVNKKMKLGSSMIVLDGAILVLKGARSTMLYAYEPAGEYYSATPAPEANVMLRPQAPKVEIAVAPNPASRVARISVPGNSSVLVNVYTTDGRLVRTYNTNECDVSGLANGIYLAKVTANSQTATLRLVVEH